jgi:hypothetical protein
MTPTTAAACLVAAALGCASGAVSASCEFRSGSGTGLAAFPELDPVTASNVTATIQLNVKCVPTADFAVAQWTWTSANGGGSVGRLAGGTPVYAPGIPYSVGITVANQGANGTLTLNLQIAGAAYVNASAGMYTDILTLAVTP